jgi:hypothetical protein
MQQNQQFLVSFFRVLIEGGDLRFHLDYKEKRKLWRPSTAYQQRSSRPSGAGGRWL